MNNNVVVYRPDLKEKQSIYSMFVQILKNLAAFKFMLVQLFIRDFTASYKKSFLGLFWVVFAPLVSVVAWVFLQKTGLLNPGNVDVPYPVYVLVGTLAWDFLVGIHRSASKTLLSGRSIALQIKYPHELLFFKEILLFTANFSIRFFIVLIAISVLGYPPHWATVLFPIIALPVIFMMGGLGLLTSLLEAITTDTSKVNDVAFKFLIWTVPIIYSSKVSHWLVEDIIRFNPLTYLVCSLRDIILYGELYQPEVFWLVSGMSFLFFIVCVRIFYITEERLVEKML